MYVTPNLWGVVCPSQPFLPQVSNLRMALSFYMWVVTYCNAHLEAAERVFMDELVMCRQMTELLPLKIAAMSPGTSASASA